MNSTIMLRLAPRLAPPLPKHRHRLFTADSEGARLRRDLGEQLVAPHRPRPRHLLVEGDEALHVRGDDPYRDELHGLFSSRRHPSWRPPLLTAPWTLGAIPGRIRPVRMRVFRHGSTDRSGAGPPGDPAGRRQPY